MWITFGYRIGEFVLTIVWDINLTEWLILWVVIARLICLQLVLRSLVILTYKTVIELFLFFGCIFIRKFNKAEETPPITQTILMVSLGLSSH